MSITINYKGWDFEFDGLPSSDDIEARYRAVVEKTEITIPVPRPTPLQREAGPYAAKPLADRTVLFGGAGDGPVAEVARSALRAAGATVTDAGETEEPGKVEVLAFDGTDLQSLEQLAEVHAFFHGHLRSLKSSGRVVVLGRRASDAETPTQAAAWRGLDAFVRSLAREVGPSGSTVNRITVSAGAEDQLAGPLVFMTSPRSAYVTAQSLHVGGRGQADTDAGSWASALAGKVAVVTGAAGGIGLATAKRLAAEGAKVVCVDLPGNDALQGAADSVNGVALPLDITADVAPARLAEVATEHGGIDLLIHNAGIVRDDMITMMAADTWRLVLDVNAGAPARITEHLLEGGHLNDGGRVIFVSSIVGISGSMGQTNYATSKAAMLGMVEHYSERLIERGITVNAVAPGTTETKQVADASSLLREAGRRLNALSQMGRADDHANVMAFLCTPQAQGLNGQCVRVCGGALPGA
jgi:3-oxoacyl-[acyl-carrier protein] reductase